MNQSSNYHHALPVAVSEMSTKDTATSICLSQPEPREDELDSWVATLKDTWFNDINTMSTKGHRQLKEDEITAEE